MDLENVDLSACEFFYNRQDELEKYINLVKNNKLMIEKTLEEALYKDVKQSEVDLMRESVAELNNKLERLEKMKEIIKSGVVYRVNEDKNAEVRKLKEKWSSEFEGELFDFREFLFNWAFLVELPGEFGIKSNEITQFSYGFDTDRRGNSRKSGSIYIRVRLTTDTNILRTILKNIGKSIYGCIRLKRLDRLSNTLFSYVFEGLKLKDFEEPALYYDTDEEPAVFYLRFGFKKMRIEDATTNKKENNTEKDNNEGETEETE